jgi:imidazolonepropionase-like amidohydrolase
MRAIRARHAFDGETFHAGGATVLVEDGTVRGVEAYAAQLPADCPVTDHAGTLLPGLVDAHTHLVGDGELGALDRVAGYTHEEIDAVITRALHDQLVAGVTTVRDLGDRRFCVVIRRDRQHDVPATEPTILASGPPLTSRGGHCHFMGGEVSGADEIARAVAERAELGVDVVKVMASGGMATPSTDVLRTQFTTEELRLVVDLAHAAGLPVTAHAHGTPAVQQALAVGVDGIEHCSCLTDQGFGQVGDETLADLARSRIVVCPTLGMHPDFSLGTPPPQIVAMAARLGTTPEAMLLGRRAFAARLHAAGIRLISGVDSGINPAKRHGLLGYAICELVEAGIDVATALVTATSGAAEAIGVGRRKGRLATGYDADLLAVNGDLETDATALLRPESVWLRGVPVGG